jgi:hypothetical protein
MLILDSMTRAAPETKLILLLLLVHGQNYGMDAQLKALVTSNTVGLTRNQINTGYCYLVDEGYLWEVKTPSKCQQTGKLRKESIYGLTQASIDLWVQTVNQMMWKDDVSFLLSNKLGGSFQKLVNNDGQTTDCLLVLIGLLAYANPAKYVCGCDTRLLSQLLGLSEARIRRAISALAKSDRVSVAAQGVGDSKMFGQLAPIYRIHSVRINMKLINVGVFVETTLMPFNFINDLREFYNKMKKNSAKSRFRHSKQVSILSDEMYYELAKMITGKRIEASIYHLCLSTIFSLVPWHAEVLGVLDSQEATEESTNRSDVELQNQIFDSLSMVLFRGSFALQELNQTNFQQDPISISDYMAQMRQYTLDSLTRELSSIIKGLSKQWIIFIEGQSLKQAKLVGYLPFGTMALIPYKTGDLASAQLPTLPEQATDDLQNGIVSCILTAHVPNDKKYDHCAVMDDELWVVEASISGKRIRHIKRMICANRKTKFFDISG